MAKKKKIEYTLEESEKLFEELDKNLSIYRKFFTDRGENIMSDYFESVNSWTDGSEIIKKNKELLNLIEEEKEKDMPYTIMVIGKDQKQHMAEPHKEVCLCGIEILRKKYLKNDHNLYSCYECTF